MCSSVAPASTTENPQTSFPGGFRPPEQYELDAIKLRYAREALDGIYDEDVGGRRLDSGVLQRQPGRSEDDEKKLDLQAMARSSLYSSFVGRSSR
jgi:hypothetical protein